MENAAGSRRTHLIIAADNSASMTGGPIRQVKSALIEILSQTLPNPYITTNLLTYNDRATVIPCDESNFVNVIDRISACRQTSFKEAFQLIAKLVEGEGNNFTKRIIIFLTDGNDSFHGNKPIGKMVESLLDTGKPFTLHSVGFSKDHNFKFLSSLCKLSQGDGLFRYCDNDDGPEALKEKLQELFDFILSNLSSTIDVNVHIDGDAKILCNGSFVNETMLQGDVVNETELQGDGVEENTPSDSAEGETVVTAEAWIYLTELSSLPTFTLTISKEINTKEDKKTYTIPCKIKNIQQVVITSPPEKVHWHLRTLFRNADILAAKLGEAISNNADISKFNMRIDKLQEKLSHIPLFNLTFDKERREAFKSCMIDIQAKVSKMRSTLAEYVRGNTQSIQMLARAHDMRYQAKFSKSRRQRIMDKRAVKNIGKAKYAQMQLDSLDIRKEDVERISTEAAELYFCALSQNSVKDLLLSGDKEDMMGFGLAVQRPEHVLDEPSLIKICNISGTFVSRVAMLDALEYKINCDGQLSAHGGFDFDNPLGVTTVGLSREPINAWLPLYCNEQHWKKVQVMMKPTLGYFCTLDPLGFDFRQYNVMFMVLGSMVGQVNDDTLGEHQIKHIFSFLRTCYALAEDLPNFQNETKTMLDNFLQKPGERLKHVIPNLSTLIGRMLVLPPQVLRLTLGVTDEDPVGLTKQFWRGFLAEVTRRAAGKVLRDTSKCTINGLIDVIINSDLKDTCYSTADLQKDFIKMCVENRNDKADLPDVNFDPKKDIKVKEVKVKHSEKMDKVMELWAQSECGLIKNKNQADKVAAANKTVKNWRKEGSDIIENEMLGEGGENQQFDPNTVTEPMIQYICKLITILTQSTHNILTSIPGCIGFFDYMLSNSIDVTKMDKDHGVPPQRWIQGVKEAVSKMYSCLSDYQKQMMSETRNEEETVEVLTCLPVPPSDTVCVSESSTCTDTSTVDTTVGSLNASVGKPKPESDNDDDDSNDDLSDDNDEEFVYSDDDDDVHIDYTSQNLRSQNSRSKPRRARLRHLLTLPIIYHGIDPNIDVIQSCRVLLYQVICYHSNSNARSAITTGKFTDLSQDVDYCQELSDAQLLLIQMKENAVQDTINRAMWDRANQCMLQATTVWAFIGYMMTTYKDRDLGIINLLNAICEVDKANNPYPLLAEKLRVILLGKYQDAVVLANGNVRLVEQKLAKRFIAVIGEELWSEIELETRANVKLHVYRESDIPNRHGHCNSNPYIPNSLRKKLGMPLLKR